MLDIIHRSHLAVLELHDSSMTDGGSGARVKPTFHKKNLIKLLKDGHLTPSCI